MDGSPESTPRFDFAFKLAFSHLAIKTKPKGYSGCGRHSSASFDTSHPLEVKRVLELIKDFADLDPWDLAGQLNQAGLLGPKPGEDLSKLVNLSSKGLKEWAIAYYELNGIDDPESFHVLERNSKFNYREVEIENLAHNLNESYLNPIKILAYQLLLRNQTLMPPLICRKHGWELYEGYHRLAAHKAEGLQHVSCIVIGTR